jgi:hypothetical protein
VLLTVHEGATSLGKTREGNGELDTLAIGTGGGLDGASESGTGLLGKSTNELVADGVVGHLRSGRNSRGLSSDGSGGRGQHGDDREKHLGRRSLDSR